MKCPLTDTLYPLTRFAGGDNIIPSPALFVEHPIACDSNCSIPNVLAINERAFNSFTFSIDYIG